MAARTYRRGKRQAIRRLDLQARTNDVTLDARNRPTGESFNNFTLVDCTVQPTSGDVLQTLPEGFRDAETYNIFTDTEAKPAIRGTNQKADEVFLDTPFTSLAGWFTVIKVKSWQNQHIPHYQLIVVRKNPT
jgi:hypothetical protein